MACIFAVEIVVVGIAAVGIVAGIEVAFETGVAFVVVDFAVEAAFAAFVVVAAVEDIGVASAFVDTVVAAAAVAVAWGVVYIAVKTDDADNFDTVVDFGVGIVAASFAAGIAGTDFVAAVVDNIAVAGPEFLDSLKILVSFVFVENAYVDI